MNFELTIIKTKEIQAELELIFVIDKDFKHPFVQDKKLLKKAGFEAEQDETCLLLGEDKLYVGASSLKASSIRTAAAHALKTLMGKNYKSIKVATYTDKGSSYALRAMIEGFILGAYTFQTYKSKKNENKIKHISISLDAYDDVALNIKEASLQVHKAQIIADATNFTRDIVNTTPEDCYK